MESAADDVCGGGRCTLAEDLARMQAMLRELEASVDRQQDLPPAAREICGEMARRVDRSLRIVKSWGPAGPESPGSDDGSPRGQGNAGSKNAAPFKRRKGVPSVRQQVRVQGAAPAGAPDDGFSWRKYGQKDILGAKYPRAYFRCTHRHTQSCLATKQVQRTDGDPLLFDVVYHGAHTCVQGAGAHLGGTEQQLQPEPGHNAQEQGSMEAGGGIQAGFEPTTPFPFAGTDPVATDVVGCSYPLLSPTGLEWPQLRSSHGLGAAMGTEFEHQMEHFFSNPCDSFQWIQELHLAN